MYDQTLIDRWLSLYPIRLPGEGIIEAIVRLLYEHALIPRPTLDLLDPWRAGSGVKVAGIFLPNGTRLRAVCLKCNKFVQAMVIQGEISVEGKNPTSAEWARRTAIDVMDCHTHSRSKLGIFWGRRAVEFWDVWHKGEWRRLTYFRLPGDDGRRPG